MERFLYLQFCANPCGKKVFQQSIIVLFLAVGRHDFDGHIRHFRESHPAARKREAHLQIRLWKKTGSLTKYDRWVVVECSTRDGRMRREAMMTRERTVSNPLKLVTSTSAPTSFSENFSNNRRMNGIFAIVWKRLLNARFVNAVPSFLVTALNKKRIFLLNYIDGSYISGTSGSFAKSFCREVRSSSSSRSSSL